MSRKLLRIIDRLACFSFRSALASIWRMPCARLFEPNGRALTGQSAELAEFTGLLDLAQHMLEQIALGVRVGLSIS
jgi:hypothetical protein